MPCAKLVADAVRELSGLDILVSNAARQHAQASILDISTEQFDDMFKTNVYAMFWIMKAELPDMKPGSAIITTSSVNAYNADKTIIDYAATKGALIQLAKVIAIDHAEQNVRCNALSPGAVETQRTLRRYNSFEVAKEKLGVKHLTGRLGKPEELAQAAVFLASDAASFVTGSDLLVDGGYTAI